MTDEKPAIKTTIVGGRPPGCGTDVGNIPRGLEVLIKKAAVDPPFRTRLIEWRSAVADEIGLPLTGPERMMLDSIPAVQLKSIITNTRVDSMLIPILAKGTAAAILAALGICMVTGCTPQSKESDIPSVQPATASPSQKPSVPETNSDVSRGIRPDPNLPDPRHFHLTLGIRPDLERQLDKGKSE